MTGKGDKRRPTMVDDQVLQDNWDRVFGIRVPMECPACGEIELRPTASRMYECDSCNIEVQL